MADTFNLVPDGTVEFEFDSDTTPKVVLRRPTLGDYRMLVEELTKLRAETRDAEEAARADNIDARGVSDLQDALLDWYRLVFKTLGNHELPDESELPAWMLNGAMTQDLVGHWQKVPSRRGVR